MISNRSYIVRVSKRNFVALFSRMFVVEGKSRQFLVTIPKRTYQTIEDTANRVVGGVEFTHWGQENIRLREITKTFGDLP